jgi:hypothetical protein
MWLRQGHGKTACVPPLIEPNGNGFALSAGNGGVGHTNLSKVRIRHGTEAL